MLWFTLLLTLLAHFCQFAKLRSKGLRLSLNFFLYAQFYLQCFWGTVKKKSVKGISICKRVRFLSVFALK